MNKVIGIIFTLIFTILFISLIFVIIIEYIQIDNNNLANLFVYMGFGIVAIIMIVFIMLPMAITQRLRIYENGISPHRRPFNYWIKRKEYFIPYSELERIITNKATDGSQYVILYPKNWKRIVVWETDTGSIVFEKLSEIVKNFNKKSI